MMKSYQIGMVVLVFVVIIMANNAQAQIITLRSGNGNIGDIDSQVNMLIGPQDSPFSSAFVTANFTNARNGSDAFIIAPHPAWGSGLSGDNISKWISTRSTGATQGDSALYAVSFNLSDPFGSATLNLHFVVDNVLGSVSNQGVFLNGVAISGNSSVGSFPTETIITRNDIGSLLFSGENTLYINATDLGGPSSLIFRATIETSLPTIPEPNIAVLLGVGIFSWLGLGCRFWQPNN
jgi:hypothetical protein